MDINVFKNVKLNVKMYSNNDLYEIEDYNYEVNQNILTVTSKIRVTMIQTPTIELLFEVKSNIDLDQINEPTRINLPIDEYKFISSNVDPNNFEDVCKIIAVSNESCLLSIEDSKLPYYIKKDPSILNNLILLIDKSNEDHIEYDKNDVDSVVNTYHDIVDGESYITEWFYNIMKEVDPVIADKIMTSIQKVVKEEWDPYIGDGLDDVLTNNISIYIKF